MAARPDTPDPGKGTGPGPANVDGNVDFKGADIKNSIATGHIHGYEVILATINVTVDAANDLTNNIHDFVAKVDVQLHLVSSKVGATTSVLRSINALVVKQAKKQGLTVDREVKEATKLQNEKTDRGNIAGDPEQTRQKLDAANEILTMTCFQAIIERTEGAQKAFNDISGKIKEALKNIGLLKKLHQDGQETVAGVSVRGPGPDAQRQSGNPKGKVELSDKDRNDVRLTEKELMWMEKTVEIHCQDLYYRFIVFEFSLDDERQDKEEDDIESIKQELERLKLIGKNIWKEMKRLAKYLCGNDNPPGRPDDIRGPRPQPPPEALRQYLPEPSRVNSLYVGWEFRKSSPLPPPHQYGRLDQQAQKPSWRFVVPQRMPFSTEELFLRVLAQAAQRAKSDRTLMDEYRGALKKARQRVLVDRLVQAQNHHLQRDFPQLEWTIAGLETKTDRWALIGAYTRSWACWNKKRKSITAFEVILKTQWRITGGYVPPMHIPVGFRGPMPVGPFGPGLRPGPLPGGGRGAPPGGYRPQGPRGPVGGGPFPSGGGAQGGHGVPIMTPADAGIPGGREHMPQIPVDVQTRPRKSTRSKNRPMMMLHEPLWVLVKESRKETKKSQEKKKKGRRKDAGEHKTREQTSKPRVHVELREPGRPAAAVPSGRGHRPSSPPGPGISHRSPLVPPLRPPPPPMPASGFVPPAGGRLRAHIPPVPPGARPPPPQPAHIHMSSAQIQREEEEEEEEAEEVFKEILEEFSELTDPKGKKNKRSPDAAMSVAEERRRMKTGDRRRKDAEPGVGISRSLMKQVEQASSRKLTADNHRVRLKQMAEGPLPPPPGFEGPVQAERRRMQRPYMEVERARKSRKHGR